MRRSVKRAVGLGLLAAITLAIWKAWRARVPAGPRDIEWSSAPFPFPPVPRPAVHATELPPYVDAGDDGSCPVDYPIKGKLTSGIYHPPGGANYERTHADRCYRDDDAALRDGLRRSKV